MNMRGYSEADQMTPEAQRIAIVRFCGWGVKTSKDGKRTWCKRPEWTTTKHAWWKGFGILPQLDLNLLNIAEGRLTPEQAFQYYEIELPKACGGKGIHNHAVISAKAEPRAEAVLRTIGEWEETK